MVTKSDFKNGNVNQASFVQLNPDLMTDGGYGERRRVRVDVGQTGFFAGRNRNVQSKMGRAINLILLTHN